MRRRDGIFLGRLGSRFSLQFEPQRKYVHASPLGRGFDRPLRLEISAATNGTRVVWPFSPGEQFDDCRVRLTLSRVEFALTSRALDAELLIRFTAPFYPQDERLSCAPFFYLDLAAKSGSRDRDIDIRIGLFSREEEAVSREGTAVVLRGNYQLALDGPSDDPDAFSCRRFSGLIGLIPLGGRLSLKETTFTMSCEGGEEARASFILAAHCAEPVLNVEGSPQQLYYLEYFPSLADVAAFAKNEEVENRRKSYFFDNVIARSSLGAAEKDVIAASFHSFLTSTWWTQSGAGSEWLGCWDERYFHGAIEAEYQASLLLLNLWPELLEKVLRQHAEYAERFGFLPSCCGRQLTLSPSEAPAADQHMTSDYLLLLFSHWRWWNNFAVIEENFPLVRNLSLSLASSRQDGGDSNGSGADASRLLLKLLCAVAAAAVMAEEAGDTELAGTLQSAQREMRRSLEVGPQACVDGLLHHIMCDSMPELDRALLRQIFASSTADDLSGDSSGRDDLLRDVTTAYFGTDRLQSRRYRDLQIPSAMVSNSSNETELWSAMGIVQALLGLKFDRVEQTFSVSPLSVPARLPLIPFADWEDMRIPWAEVWSEGNQMKVECSEVDLVEKEFDFVVEPHRELRWGGA